MNKTRTFAIFAVLFTILAGLLSVKHFKAPRGRPVSSAAKKFYQCAMHPQIVSDKPGDCPICHMRLQETSSQETSSQETSSQEEETPAQERGDVNRSETVVAPAANPPEGAKPLFYRHPMRPDVTSPTPAKDEMGMDYIPVYKDEASGRAGGGGEMPGNRIPGHAAFALSPERQQLIGVTTARVERRNLSVEIRAVGKVAYDPELYNALAEYHEALSAAEKIKNDSPPEARERAQSLLRSSELRLRLMGLSGEQIARLEKQTADPVNLLLPGKSVWVYAQVYEREADLARPGQIVRVTAPSSPGQVFGGKVAAVDSILNAATRTVRVRIEIQTPEESLRPETFVHVTIQVPLGMKMAVPEDAVLDTGEHQIVFVKKGEGEFQPRAVRLGRQARGFYEALSGVQAGEEVVTSANFLIDSESRFRSALESFSKRKPAGSSAQDD